MRIRLRANFSCEYCGTSETDSGAELTLDHYQPISSGGTDDQANLIYCCYRCNLYKGDYWHSLPEHKPLYNPRVNKYTDHFLFLESGELLHLTEIAEITIKILRLNRKPLLAWRRVKYYSTLERQIIEQLHNAIEILAKLSEQQRELLIEQQSLLEEQHLLLEKLLSET